MDKKSIMLFLDRQKHPALLVGLGVAIIHFVLAYLLNAPWNIAEITPFNFILTAPSYFLMLISPSIMIPFSMFPELDISYTISKFDVIIFSSLSYGIVAGLFFLDRKKLYWIGIIFTGLLILLNSFWHVWTNFPRDNGGSPDRNHRVPSTRTEDDDCRK